VRRFERPALAAELSRRLLAVRAGVERY
jgi:hypothetical protein